MVRALFDAEGNITEFQAVIQDITRRKQSEEALRLGEERLRAILHSMVDGVIVLDERGLATCCSIRRRKRFSNASPRRYSTSPCRNSSPPDDRPNYDDYLAGIWAEPRQGHRSRRRCSRAAGTLPIDLAVSEISRGGARMRIVVVRDISERKKLEEQYRQSQKMEAVGRLAGGIAHDFNNLMQAILGYSNLLDRRLAPGDPNHETVEHIQKSLAHATSLTRQLLAFSRKQVLKPKLLP